MNAIWKLLGMWLLVRAVEDGGGASGDDGGGDGGAGPESGAGGDQGAPAGGAEGGGAGEAGKPGDVGEGGGADGEQPSSMLEAIQKQLKSQKQDDKPPEGQQPPGDGKPGKPQQGKPEDDPTKMPDGLAPDAQNRFKRLVTTLKTRDTELVQEKQAHQQTQETLSGFRELLQTNGASADQFGAAVSVIGLVNSGHPENVRRARDFLLQQARELSLQLGEPMPDSSNDILAEFPDLQQAVGAMQMSEQYAIELARSRRQQFVREQSEAAARQTQQQQTEQQQAFQQSAQQAYAEIAKISAAWKAKDIDYLAKEVKIVEQLPGIMKKYPPHLWVDALTQIYNGLSTGATLVNRGQPAGREPRPLSGGNGPPAPAAPPKTMKDAIAGVLRHA